MGSCSSRHRIVEQVSETDLRNVGQQSLPERSTVKKSTRKKSVSVRTSKVSSEIGFGKWNKKLEVTLSVKLVQPTDAKPNSADLFFKLTGMDIGKHPVVMAIINLKPKCMANMDACLLQNPKIAWGEMRITRQVPQFLPANVTVPELKVFAILERDSPVLTTIQLQGRIEDEKVFVMCSVDKEKSDVSVHHELFSHMNVKVFNNKLCWSCKEKLPASSCRPDTRESQESGSGDHGMPSKIESQFQSPGDVGYRRNSTVRYAADELQQDHVRMPESCYFRSSHELPPLGSGSLSSLSTVAQIGSRTNSPNRSDTSSPYHERCHVTSRDRQEELIQHQQQQPILPPPPKSYQQPGRKKKVRRPTPITPKTPRQIVGKKHVMQIFFEDEEDNRSLDGHDNLRKTHLPCMTVDRKCLPSIEGESRPPSAEHQNEAAAFRKFKWTPVIENSESDADVDVSEDEAPVSKKPGKECKDDLKC